MKHVNYSISWTDPDGNAETDGGYAEMEDETSAVALACKLALDLLPADATTFEIVISRSRR